MFHGFKKTTQKVRAFEKKHEKGKKAKKSNKTLSRKT